jgi:hypothetical protein
MPTPTRQRLRNARVALACIAFSAIGAAAMVWWFSDSSGSRGQPELAALGSVFQSDTIVGMGVGAKFDPVDTRRLHFAEITNANNFDFRRDFEFQKYVLKVVRVHEVKDRADADSSTPHTSRTLVGVVATVIWKRD